VDPRKIYKVIREVEPRDYKKNPEIPKNAEFKAQVPTGNTSGPTTKMVYGSTKKIVQDKIVKAEKISAQAVENKKGPRPLQRAGAVVTQRGIKVPTAYEGIYELFNPKTKKSKFIYTTTKQGAAKEGAKTKRITASSLAEALKKKYEIEGNIPFTKSGPGQEFKIIEKGTVPNESNIKYRKLKNAITGEVKTVYDVQFMKVPPKGTPKGQGKYSFLLNERDVQSLDEAIKIRDDYRIKNPIVKAGTEQLNKQLKDLYNNPKIKPLLETGIPDKKYIKIAQNTIKGLTESQAEDKLKQLAEAVKPDGVYNIEGIDKINQNKANNIYQFFKSKDVSRNIEDIAIGKSVGEGSLEKPRGDIQKELPFKGGTKTYSVDEAKAIKGSYRLGSRPYSIFGQVIDGRINQGAKMGMDAKLSQFEEGVQKAIRGEGKLSVKEAIDKYNAAATQFEKEMNAYKSRGFRKITIPRIAKAPPSQTIANKKAYKKYKKFFDKNFKELGYSFRIPKDLLPVPEIAAGMKDKKSPIYKRYFNDLKKAASEFIDNVNQYDEKELFEKIQKHPKFEKFKKIIPRLASLDMNLPNFSVFTPAMADEMAMFETETPVAEEQNFIERNPKTTAAAGAVGSLGFKGVRKAAGKALSGLFGPTGVALTYPVFGFDPESSLDRTLLGAELAGAKSLVSGAQKFRKGIKNPALRKAAGIMTTINPKYALKAARVATPAGLVSLGGEALYNYGKFAKNEIDRVRAMPEDERRAYNEALMDEGSMFEYE
jgi:hypothetical protein